MVHGFYFIRSRLNKESGSSEWVYTRWPWVNHSWSATSLWQTIQGPLRHRGQPLLGCMTGYRGDVADCEWSTYSHRTRVNPLRGSRFFLCFAIDSTLLPAMWMLIINAVNWIYKIGYLLIYQITGGHCIGSHGRTLPEMQFKLGFVGFGLALPLVFKPTWIWAILRFRHWAGLVVPTL